MTVRRLSDHEKASACALAWKVFLSYEAPEYPQEGVDAFRSFLDDRGFISDMPFYGAFDGDKLVGMLMRRPQTSACSSWTRRTTTGASAGCCLRG